MNLCSVVTADGVSEDSELTSNILGVLGNVCVSNSLYLPIVYASPARGAPAIAEMC